MPLEKKAALLCNMMCPSLEEAHHVMDVGCVFICREDCFQASAHKCWAYEASNSKKSETSAISTSWDPILDAWHLPISFYFFENFLLKGLSQTVLIISLNETFNCSLGPNLVQTHAKINLVVIIILVN